MTQLQRQKVHRYEENRGLFPSIFKYSRARHSFTLAGHPYRGVIKSIERVFCPPGAGSDYVHEMCRLTHAELDRKNGHTHSDVKDDGGLLVAQSKTKAPRGPKTFDPVAAGLKQHRELATWINHGYNQTTGLGGKKVKAPTQQTLTIMFLLTVKLKLHIIAAEVPVWDRASRVATQVDILARKNDGTWVIIELKTGRSEDYKVAFGNLLYPLQDVGLSKHNLHQLQLMATIHLFKKRLNLGTAEVQGLVVLASYQSVEVFPLAKWCTARDTQFAMAVGLNRRTLCELQLEQSQHESTPTHVVNILKMRLEKVYPDPSATSVVAVRSEKRKRGDEALDEFDGHLSKAKRS